MWHDLTRQQFHAFPIVANETGDEQLRANALIFADEIEGLRDGERIAAKLRGDTPSIALGLQLGFGARQQQTGEIGAFDRVIVSLLGFTVLLQHVELVPHGGGITEQVAGIAVARQHAQRQLLAAPANHDRRMRLLQRFRLEDGFFDVEVFAVEGGARLGPQSA